MTLTRRHLLFAALLAAAALAFLPSIRTLVHLSLALNLTTSHLVVIPFVTLYLVWQDRQHIFTFVRTGTAGGLVLGAVGLAMLWAGSAYGPLGDSPDVLSIRIAALVVLALAAFLVCYGPAAARRAAFPLLFLFFFVPIPSAVLDSATLWLKAGSANCVAYLLTLTRTPFFRDGYVFAMPTVTIEIADECSGIRSTIALVLTMLLAGDMFLERPWTKALLVLAIVPITLLKNAVRIVVLSLLAIHVDPSFLTGQLHHEGGIVFFVLALAMLTPVFALLKRLETRRGPRVAAAGVARA